MAEARPLAGAGKGGLRAGGGASPNPLGFREAERVGLSEELPGNPHCEECLSLCVGYVESITYTNTRELGANACQVIKYKRNKLNH